MNKFQQKLRKKFQQELEGYLEDIEPAKYLQELIRDALDDIKNDAKNKVLSLLGIDMRWGQPELKKDGPLAQMAQIELERKFHDQIQGMMAQVEITPAMRKRIVKTASEHYELSVLRRVERLVEQWANDALDAEIEALLGSEEP